MSDKKELMKLKKADLQALCKEKGIAYNEKDTKDILSQCLLGARAQGARAQGARAQGARAQGARAQGARAQGARAQDDGIVAVAKHIRTMVIVAPVINAADAFIKSHELIVPYQDLVGNDPRRIHPDTCQNLMFELSSGTSNILNFPGTMLPFIRIEPNGWLHKDGDMFNDFNSRVNKQTMLPMNIIFNYIAGRIKSEKEAHSAECVDRAVIFLKEFLSRFGTWKQLQISASFGGPVWDETYIGRLLKEFVLTYSVLAPVLFKGDGKSKKITNQLRQLLNVDDAFKHEDYTALIDAGKHITNFDKIERYDHGYRYFRDDTIVQRRVLPEPTLKLSNIEDVNAWATANNAMCNPGPFSMTSAEKKKVLKDHAPHRDKIPRGWDDCD